MRESRDRELSSSRSCSDLLDLDKFHKNFCVFCVITELIFFCNHDVESFFCVVIEGVWIENDLPFSLLTESENLLRSFGLSLSLLLSLYTLLTFQHIQICSRKALWMAARSPRTPTPPRV